MPATFRFLEFLTAILSGLRNLKTMSDVIVSKLRTFERFQHVLFFVFQQRKAPASYKSAGQLPREREVKELKIYVDKKYETIILPIWGIPVPFHICTIKNISTSIEGE